MLPGVVSSTDVVPSPALPWMVRSRTITCGLCCEELDVARKVIPSEVIDRPKGYFPVPALKYIDGPYLDMVRDALTSQAARERGLFAGDYLDMLFDDPTGHITPLRGSELWQVGLLELWLQSHGVG